MSRTLRFGLRLYVIQVAASLVAFAFASLLVARLLVLGPLATSEAHRAYAFGFVLHVVVLGVGTLRELRKATRPLGRTEPLRPIDVLYLYRVSVQLSGAALVGGVLVAMGIALVPFGDGSLPAAVRGSIGLFGFTSLLGFHLAAYVFLRQVVGHELTLLDPVVAGQAGRLHAHTLERMGTIALRVALGVSLSVYFVAQGTLLHTGAHVRDAQEDARREIGHDVDVVVALGAPAVRDRIGPLAQAAGMSAVPPARIPRAVPGAPAPLAGQGAFAAIGFACALVVSLAALAVGSMVGRSYAGALRRVAKEIAGMGDDAHGVRAEVLDASRYGDVTDLMLAVGELGHLFQRFAIAKNTAAASNVRTERMRAQFLTSMSHDLKAPMNAVLGFAELLSRHPLTPGQHENVTIVKQRGEELMLLIQTVLDSARLEAESFVLDPASYMLEDLMREAIGRAHDLGDDGNVEIVADLEDNHEVIVDAERLRFALLLLLRTAQRLTSPGLAVYIRAGGQRTLGIVELIIESSGGALSPAELSRMFEAFHYTADARKFGSLGLGLSLAQSIVALSRGKIDVSASDSGALRIELRLPTPRDTDPSMGA